MLIFVAARKKLADKIGMCLAFPGKIVSIVGNQAEVAFDGIIKQVNLALISDPEIGDHVIVHSGFAVEKLSNEDAWEVLKEYEKSKKL